MLKLLSITALLLALAIVASTAMADRPSPAPSPADGTAIVDEARAAEIAIAAFAAFDAGDYAGWSRDWSEAMRSAISEEAFGAWRGAIIEQLGGFVSLGSPTRSSRQAGTYRWSFPVTFERGSASIGFGFVEGRDEVEGVFAE